MFFLVDSMLGQPASNSLTKHHTTNCDVFVGELPPLSYINLFCIGLYFF